MSGVKTTFRGGNGADRPMSSNVATRTVGSPQQDSLFDAPRHSEFVPPTAANNYGGPKAAGIGKPKNVKLWKDNK